MGAAWKNYRKIDKRASDSSDKNMMVEISMDGGDTSRSISLVGKVCGAEKHSLTPFSGEKNKLPPTDAEK